MEEQQTTPPDPCTMCHGRPVPSEQLSELFIQAQTAAVREFLSKEPVKGHTNGCILTRMVASGLHPEICVGYMQSRTVTVPRILRPGELPN